MCPWPCAAAPAEVDGAMSNQGIRGYASLAVCSGSMSEHKNFKVASCGCGLHGT